MSIHFILFKEKVTNIIPILEKLKVFKVGNLQHQHCSIGSRSESTSKKI